MKVRVGSKYQYVPSGWDILDQPSGALSGDLKSGDIVKVINLHGCPPANTMGQCYIGTLDYEGAGIKKKGKFLGMVSTNSLEKTHG